VALLAMIPFSLPTMLRCRRHAADPVAALADAPARANAWIWRRGMNFAGLSPAVLTLWFGHHEITYAASGDVDSGHAVSYTAVGGGLGALFIMPPIVMTVMAATSKRRAANLHSPAQKTGRGMGQEVQGNPPAPISIFN